MTWIRSDNLWNSISPPTSSKWMVWHFTAGLLFSGPSRRRRRDKRQSHTSPCPFRHPPNCSVDHRLGLLGTEPRLLLMLFSLLLRIKRRLSCLLDLSSIGGMVGTGLSCHTGIWKPDVKRFVTGFSQSIAHRNLSPNVTLTNTFSISYRYATGCGRYFYHRMNPFLTICRRGFIINRHWFS